MEHDEQIRLLERWQKNHDQRAGTALMGQFETVVKNCTRSLAQYTSREDLEQEARMGVATAINTYNPSHKTRLFRWVQCCVLRAVVDYMRHRMNPVALPRSVFAFWRNYLKVSGSLADQLDRKPTLAEVAREMGRSEEDTQITMSLCVRFLYMFSLDAPTMADCLGSGGTLYDTEASSDNRPERLDRILVDQCLARLTPRQSQVMHRRFFDQATFGEIAAEIGVSSGRVHQICAESLHLLAEMLEPVLAEM